MSVYAQVLMSMRTVMWLNLVMNKVDRRKGGSEVPMERSTATTTTSSSWNPSEQSGQAAGQSSVSECTHTVPVLVCLFGWIGVCSVL